MKIAVCTTFPYDYWNMCAAEMVATVTEFWPQECNLFIQLDNLPEQQYNTLYNAIKNTVRKDMPYFVGNVFEQEQIDFLKRRENDQQTDNYRFQYKRFSYKVFALHKAALYANMEGYDYIIWLDADVITRRPISLDDLKKMLPSSEEVVSYLGRKDAPHSECGFVAYDLKNGGLKLIEAMREYYTTDKTLQLSGWTDCDVFDDVRKNLKITGKNLSDGVPGYHVWPLTELGRFMEHRKGQRKVNNGVKPAVDPAKAMQKNLAQHQAPMSLADMTVKTRNCVQDTQIKDQVKENLGQIRHWATVCAKNDEEVVICSAGESLNPDDIRPFYERGVKIVAVKHAVERLLEWGIKPWACILLDPRAHVEAFVKNPDKSIIYFVSSMVHPSVVRTLNENGCKVVGYHAFVGAGEHEHLMKGDLLVSGGSATATRGICLLQQCLGFQKFHCFGYDLCRFSRPDMAELNEHGQQRYIEVTFTEKTYGNRSVTRTFWSEGQWLAQAKELADLYKGEKPLNITIYGDGLAGWTFRHYKLHQKWAKDFEGKLDERRTKSIGVNEWLAGTFG